MLLEQEVIYYGVSKIIEVKISDVTIKSLSLKNKSVLNAEYNGSGHMVNK